MHGPAVNRESGCVCAMHNSKWRLRFARYLVPRVLAHRAAANPLVGVAAARVQRPGQLLQQTGQANDGESSYGVDRLHLSGEMNKVDTAS